MKKIIVASEGNEISPHFGHCKNFNIFEVEDGKIVNSSSIDNPGHGHGFAGTLYDQEKFDIVIAGGMGAKAQDMLKERDVEVVTGASGDAKEAVEAYLVGNLENSGQACSGHGHGHHDHGEGHTCGNH